MVDDSQEMPLDFGKKQVCGRVLAHGPIRRENVGQATWRLESVLAVAMRIVAIAGILARVARRHTAIEDAKIIGGTARFSKGFRRAKAAKGFVDRAIRNTRQGWAADFAKSAAQLPVWTARRAHVRGAGWLAIPLIHAHRFVFWTTCASLLASVCETMRLARIADAVLRCKATRVPARDRARVIVKPLSVANVIVRIAARVAKPLTIAESVIVAPASVEI